MSAAYDDAYDDFEIPDVVALSKSAEEIEIESSYRDVPPGDHELVVVGFLKNPEIKTREVYLNGRRVSYDATVVIVKLALASDRSAQVTDSFDLPPGEPGQLAAYYDGLMKADGKQKGFMASKFYHFIERLGWPYPKGGNLPAEARRLGNWKGRSIHATIEPGKSYFDATSGEEKPGRNQVKLFSYRPSQATVYRDQPALPLAPAVAPPRPAATPARPTAAPIPRQTASAARGLDAV
jgi:hypothetical protein